MITKIVLSALGVTTLITLHLNFTPLDRIQEDPVLSQVKQFYTMNCMKGQTIIEGEMFTCKDIERFIAKYEPNSTVRVATNLYSVHGRVLHGGCSSKHSCQPKPKKHGTLSSSGVR